MLSDSFTKEELNIIERLYSQGIKHEIGFFLAQPLIQKVVVPLSGEHNLEERQLMIFSDFDFVFVGDHSSTILAGMATTPESDAIQTENPILRRNFISWRAIYDKYSEGYMQCIENMLATEKAENFNYEGLQKAFEPLSDILKHLNSEVMKAGVLKGLKLEDIKQTGESWFYQNVCMDFFQALIKNESLDADVHVLSYCWCDELIRSTLSAGGLNGLKVHANELEFEESVCTGEILGKVVSPMDKVEAFGKIIESCGKENDKKKLLTIYIGGDLLKDLLCLLEADIGIVVKPSTNVIEVGKHFGIKFIPLFHGVVDKQKVEGAETWKGKVGLSGILYTASSWVEIKAFFIGSRWDEAAAMSNYCKISGDHISDVCTKNQNKFPKLE
nr:probable aminopyrimidine aminohydrolase, mitochondrial [Ipomoea batatas]